MLFRFKHHVLHVCCNSGHFWYSASINLIYFLLQNIKLSSYFLSYFNLHVIFFYSGHYFFTQIEDRYIFCLSAQQNFRYRICICKKFSSYICTCTIGNLWNLWTEMYCFLIVRWSDVPYWSKFPSNFESIHIFKKTFLKLPDDRLTSWINKAYICTSWSFIEHVVK